MSHTEKEEQREQYQSFIDQLIELKHTLDTARKVTEEEQNLEKATKLLEDMKKRINYTLKEVKK